MSDDIYCQGCGYPEHTDFANACPWCQKNATRIIALESSCLRMAEDRDMAISWRDHDKERADAAEAERDALRAEVERLRYLTANPDMTRDELIWSDYMRGVSPDRLAKQHKVTRERMRQILKQIAQRVVHLDAMALDRARAAMKGASHE